MEATFVQEGLAVDYTPGSDISAGDVVELGNFCAVAKKDITSGELGAVSLTGVYDVAKKEDDTFTVGAAVYWDNDGDPYGGTAGAGCATSTATANKFMGIAVATAAAKDTTVRVLLRSIQASNAETLSLADLSDIGTMAYDAGRILVADGDSFEDVVVSGDVTLAANGAVTLNAAHAEQVVIIPFEDLAANADIADRLAFVHPRAVTLTSIGIMFDGAPAGVDDSNTSVILLEDDASNAIVTKTYNTGTQPPTSDYEDLGTLDATHKSLDAGEHVLFSITNGTTADLASGSLVIRFVPTNA